MGWGGDQADASASRAHPRRTRLGDNPAIVRRQRGDTKCNANPDPSPGRPGGVGEMGVDFHSRGREPRSFAAHIAPHLPPSRPELSTFVTPAFSPGTCDLVAQVSAGPGLGPT